MTSNYSWQPSSDVSLVPPEAVLVGKDRDGADVFVGRICHANNHLPAYVVPTKNLVRAVHGLTLINDATNFEYLIGSSFIWSFNDNGTHNLPEDAVTVGTNDQGDYCFIGRATTDSEPVIGEINLLFHIMIFNHNSTRHSTENYEVLCHPSETGRQSLTRIPHCEAKTDDYQWVSMQDSVIFPPNAVLGGYDSDRRKLYIARFWHKGDVLSGKIIGSNDVPSVPGFTSAPWGGQEHQARYYQVLTGVDFEWIPSEDGNVPDGAVSAGQTVDGENLYVGRGQIFGSLTPGKIHPSHDCLYVGHSWSEHPIHQYEVLVHGVSSGVQYEWVPCKDITQIPKDSVTAGSDVDGAPILVGRMCDTESQQIAIVIPSKQYIRTNMNEPFVGSTHFEYLTGQHFSWSESLKNGKLPKNAVPAGQTHQGEFLFIGRTVYNGTTIVGEISVVARCIRFIHNSNLMSSDEYEVLQHPSQYGQQAVTCIPPDFNLHLNNKWVTCQTRDFLPANAFLGGWDENDKDLYVGRFWHDGVVLPSKVTVNENMQIVQVSALYKGKEVSKRSCQVLTGTCFSWQPCIRGQIPPNAIKSGNNQNREELLIGRSIFEDCLILGIVQRTSGRIIFGYERQVVNLGDFEVLVLRVENDEDYQWITCSATKAFPQNTVLVGLDTDASEIFVGRLIYQNQFLPANVIPKRRTAFSSTAGHEVKSNRFQVLIGNGLGWIASSNGIVPENAIQSLSGSSEENLIFGRVQNNKCMKLGRVSPSKHCILIPHCKREHKYFNYEVLVKRSNNARTMDASPLLWISMTSDQHFPSDAVSSNSNASQPQHSNFIGRFFYEGEHLPAEIIGNLKIAVATYEKFVITSNKFEVLCGTDFCWETSSEGGITPGAVPSGKTLYGEWLFIGRTQTNNNYRISKIQPSHGCAYFPSNDKAMTCTSYEVLVQKKASAVPKNLSTTSGAGACCICWENEAIMAVIPCGNLCLCVECSQNPLLERCPVCRGPKLHCIRIYKT